MKLYDSIYRKLNIPKKSIVFDLVTTPKDLKELHHKAYTKNAVQNADLLFLPNDQGYKYALVCVDIATRKIDAEPLKTKKPTEVLKALKKIWARGYLNKPSVFFKTDDGNEFKGEVEKYFKDNGMIPMVGKSGRSRSQSVVEAVNLMLGKVIAIKHRNDEIANDDFEDDWVDDLPIIVKEYNEYVDEKDEYRKSKKKPSRKKVIYDDMEIKAPNKLFEIGDLVHIPLDKPTNFKNERLPGNFRAGDLKRERELRKITDILVGDPIVYKVEGLPNTVYTYEMLMPDTKKGKPKATKEKYEVEKILEKRKRNNAIEYLVKWKNYGNSNNEWIKRTQLIKEVPELIKDFENQGL